MGQYKGVAEESFCSAGNPLGIQGWKVARGCRLDESGQGVAAGEAKSMCWSTWSTNKQTTFDLAMSAVKVTSSPAIKNAPIIGLAEGNASFSNLHLAALIILVPWCLKRVLPIPGFNTYLFLLILLAVPITVAYWSFISIYGSRKNEKVSLPGHDIEQYITINDPDLRAKFHGKQKIPIQIFHDAYFDKKIDFKGDPASCFSIFTSSFALQAMSWM
jgi:hypothetical protein